jgi:transaldolase
MSTTPTLPHIKLFMDGADIEQMKRTYGDSRISGFTTNPTLMRKAGISDYAAFAQSAIAAMPAKPISFEVFSDTLDAMEREARIIHGWGGNTYVKIPVTNTAGLSCAPLIRKLSAEGIALNVTAIMTLEQVAEVAEALDGRTRSIVSVFAGRIADTGVDPEPLMRSAVEILRAKPAAELLWASPRELLNLYHAARVGCHIITATSDVLGKLGLIGKDLKQYSLETVKMFYNDATAAGFKI